MIKSKYEFSRAAVCVSMLLVGCAPTLEEIRSVEPLQMTVMVQYETLTYCVVREGEVANPKLFLRSVPWPAAQRTSIVAFLLGINGALPIVELILQQQGATTVVNAYVKPLFKEIVERDIWPVVTRCAEKAKAESK